MKIDIDVVSATEKAAIAAFDWIGSGNKESADKAATDAMRSQLNSLHFAGLVIMGEGEKDASFGIFPGETVGLWTKARTSADELSFNVPKRVNCYDIAIDPIEGTTPTVSSGPEAMSVIAFGGKGSMFKTDKYYMNRIVYGKKIKEKTTLSLRYPIEENLRRAASALDKKIEDVMVCVLDRPRHQNIINKLRELGIRIKLLDHCDVAGAVASCLPTSNVDFLYGIGGSPEAIISAAGIKCLGGDMEAQVFSKNETGGNPDLLFSVKDDWTPCGEIIPLERLISGPCAFAATGITNGTILRGVRVTKDHIRTQSIFMRSDLGVTRWLTNFHTRINNGKA